MKPANYIYAFGTHSFVGDASGTEVSVRGSGLEFPDAAKARSERLLP